MKKTVNVSILLVLLYISDIYAKPQLPEIKLNDQYETTNSSTTIKTNETLQRNITIEENHENEIITSERRNDLTVTSMVYTVPIHKKFYRAICAPIDAFLSAPKVIAVLRNPQLPGINDQYETTNSSATIKTNDTLQRNITIEGNHENEIIISEGRNDLTDTSMVYTVPIHTKFYRAICAPIDAFLSAPKVIAVLRNVGTCIVNGAMELISFYLPAPLIPLIASAAGMVIPFEPVVMLRDKMPVNSYKRAFMSAMNSFLGTFDRFKIDDNFVDDPYMMQRFNRRFMNDPPKGKEVEID